MPNFTRYSLTTNERLYPVNYDCVFVDSDKREAYCVDVDRTRIEFGKLDERHAQPEMWTFKPVRELPGKKVSVGTVDILVYCYKDGMAYNNLLDGIVDGVTYVAAYWPGYERGDKTHARYAERDAITRKHSAIPQ